MELTAGTGPEVLGRQVWVLVLICSGLSAEDAPETTAFQGFLRRERLTGDWGGLRSRLEEAGLAFELYYTADVIANVSGGRRRATEVLGNADLLLTADLERLVSWEGGKVFLYGLGNHGGDPSQNIGDLQNVDNIEAFDTWKLYEAWFEQVFLGRRLSVLAGLYDVNSEFDVIPAASVFLNSSQGIGADFGLSGKNGPSIFPVTSLGTRLESQFAESFSVRFVAADGVPGDPGDPRGTQVVLDDDDGLLLAGEVAFLNLPSQEVRGRTRHQKGSLPPAERHYGYFGKYAVGAWGYTTEFVDVSRTRPGGRPRTHRGTYGVYALAQQQVYYEDDDPFQGLSLFTRVGLADDSVNIVDGYIGGGGMYRGLFPGRGDDLLGFAVAAAHLGDEYRAIVGEAIDRWEVAFELTYLSRITPWLSVQPDVQYVMHPGGDPELDDAVVLGGRVIVSF